MAGPRTRRKSSAQAGSDTVTRIESGQAEPDGKPTPAGRPARSVTDSGPDTSLRAGPAPLTSEEAIDWFAATLEPIAAIAISRGVRLPVLIDGLKLALVRAAAAEPGGGGSDSRVAVMTGVHRRDLRRIRQTGATAREKRTSLAGEVFARWQSDPRFLTRRGEPRVLPRQDDGSGRVSFEALVGSISRDVHPRPVLDELVRLGMVSVQSDGTNRSDNAGGRVRLIQSAFVPSADQTEMLAFARDNLADHGRAVAANLTGGGRRFLDQALYSDALSAESAMQFNRETLDAWTLVFDRMMPRLRALYEADRESERARDHRVRLGMYGLAVVDPASALSDDSIQATKPERTD